MNLNTLSLRQLIELKQRWLEMNVKDEAARKAAIARIDGVFAARRALTAANPVAVAQAHRGRKGIKR